MTRNAGHAIVISASTGGLLAARALSDFYDQVTVLEMLPFPDAIVVKMSASIARDGDTFADIYGIIRDEVVRSPYAQDFEKVWEMLPAFVKDRENTMRYLKSLRAIIQQKMA